MTVLDPIDYTPASIAGIELAVFGAGHEVTAPTVFVVHGRNSCMQRKYQYCREMAATGITAIALNLRNHGSRSVDPSLIHPQRLESITELLSIITGTSRDISFLIDMLPALVGLTPTVVGVSGTSLGGTVAMHALLNDERIRAAAALVGTGCFRELCMYHMALNNIPQQNIDDVFTPACEALFSANDPGENCRNLKGRSVLLTVGDEDRQVPAETIRPFYEHICGIGENAATCHLEHFPAVGHDTPLEMRSYAINWLARTLADENPFTD